jgi:uncharacterized membrane protein
VQLQLPGIVAIQATAHSGPLPPPEQLQAYETVFPGAAEWIFEQSAKNADHARMVELRAIRMQQRDLLLHRLLPFGVVLAFLIACTIVAVRASAALGSVGIGVTIGAVMIAYLTGRAPGSK